MISVVIPACGSERDLLALLSVLVPAAVDGLVREVLVADPSPNAATAAICEDAGAELTADLAGAARAARGDLLLVLPSALRLRPGWDESLRRHLQAKGGAALICDRAPGLIERLAGPKLAGVLIARERLLELAPGDVGELRRRLGRAVLIS